MSTSPYVNKLGAQPGVQVDLDPSQAFELSSVADQVVGMVARLDRGPIDRPFLVTRQDLTKRTGQARSNLVRPAHEARMQMAEALDAGAAGVVVSRMVTASAIKRYASVSLGSVVVSDAVVIGLSAQAAVDEGVSVVVTVTMSHSGGAASVPYALSGLSVLDFGVASFSSGVTLTGASLSVPAGVSVFTIYIPIIEDQDTEGSEVLTVGVGGQSCSIAINDTSRAPPPPEFVYDVVAMGGWMHPTNAYNVPYIIPESGMLLMHPGPNFERPIVAFTNTFGGGQYRIRASTPPDDQPDENPIDVIKDGVYLATVSWPYGEFDQVLDLSAGETIEFPLVGDQYNGGGRFVVIEVFKAVASGFSKVADAYEDFTASSGRPTAKWAYYYRSNNGYPNGVINSAGPMLPIGGAVPQSAVQSVSMPDSIVEGELLVVTVAMDGNYGGSNIPFSISGVSIGDYFDPVFSDGVTLSDGSVSVPYGVASFTAGIMITIDGLADGGETIVVTFGNSSAQSTIANADAPGGDAAVLGMSPALWIDPSNAASMSMTGAVIDLIQDRSGNDRHCTKHGSPQITTTSLPMGGILLGSSGFSIGGAPLSMTQYTVFAVVFLDLISPSAKSIAFVANGNIAIGCDAAMVFTSGSQAAAGLQLASSTSYVYTGGVAAINAGVAHVVSLKKKAAWADAEFTLDGGTPLPVIHSGSAVSSAVFHSIGKQTTYQSGGWLLGEMVVIPRATTEVEDAVVESYLKSKWGVA